MKKYVAYYRVSTQKQGQSGLGLDAQRNYVEKFAKDASLILKDFIEVESGKNNDRPKLKEAIEYANNKSATLIIAKLDRLSRNAAFILTLRDSGVDFICADMPDANTLTVGIFALMAQHEREMISQRTKAAMQAKKAKGFKLGKPENFTAQSRLMGSDAKKVIASKNQNNRRATAMILYLRDSGMKWTHIANQLNESGFTTSQGKLFRAEQVKRLYLRNK
ncbi:recombinase family protein [Xanthocytophaga flava]|uniref:recombinase family protein n=1 Tax=Xanthocytophaga flava TaxID=3048013 RepID=UPI0028D2C803|nr:recombinase family protein [Xanthocytophaga flavus]MDJ1470352.1 recombinase family protein [Xanthocytophaga flavus]